MVSYSVSFALWDWLREANNWFVIKPCRQRWKQTHQQEITSKPHSLHAKNLLAVFDQTMSLIYTHHFM